MCDNDNNLAYLPSSKEAFLYVGPDDTTNIHVSNIFPITTTSRQSVKVIFLINKEVCIVDHD